MQKIKKNLLPVFTSNKCGQEVREFFFFLLLHATLCRKHMLKITPSTLFGPIVMSQGELMLFVLPSRHVEVTPKLILLTGGSVGHVQQLLPSWEPRSLKPSISAGAPVNRGLKIVCFFVFFFWRLRFFGWGGGGGINLSHESVLKSAELKMGSPLPGP